jgi:hypothetical protein
MQNLLSFAKLLQGFPHGNDFPEKLAKDWKQAGPPQPPSARTAESP